MREKESPYEDIIHLPHHQSETHPRMSRHDRAAQFAPFAALTGHESAIKETQRLTDREMALNEDELEILNEKLQILQENTGADQEVTFTCFVPDGRKDGGAYITHTGRVRKIDTFTRTITLDDQTMIAMARIVDMQSELFDDATMG